MILLMDGATLLPKMRMGIMTRVEGDDWTQDEQIFLSRRG